MLVFKYIKRYDREEGQELFSIAIETRIRNNGNKLHLPTLHLKIMNILMIRSEHQGFAYGFATVAYGDCEFSSPGHFWADFLDFIFRPDRLRQVIWTGVVGFVLVKVFSWQELMATKPLPGWELEKDIGKGKRVPCWYWWGEWAPLADWWKGVGLKCLMGGRYWLWKLL